MRVVRKGVKILSSSSRINIGFGQWVHRLAQRAPRNKVIVAIANKLARMAWAVLSSGKDYRHQSL
jgi:transposase